MVCVREDHIGAEEAITSLVDPHSAPLPDYCVEAVLEVEYARDSIGFRWNGCEEGDQVEGEATAELLHDGTIEIEFAYHNRDEAVPKAKRVTSSTAC